MENNLWLGAFWTESGAGQEPQISAVQVANIAADIQVLWELDQPPVAKSILPAFPLKKRQDRYDVGLLWKGVERPKDNKNQAAAALSALVKKLHSTGQYSQYLNVLKEYAQLNAVEPEPCPDKAGFLSTTPRRS